MPADTLNATGSTPGQLETDVVVAHTKSQGTHPTIFPSPNSIPPAPAQPSTVIPAFNSPDVSPHSQAVVPLLQPDSAFQAALDQIIGKANVQMRLLDSIHDAMQKELHEMFDRHDNAREAARKLGELMKANTNKR